MESLNSEEMMRYSRHFPVIGIDGQKKIKNARVLCIGAGGLGCPALQYLAAAGVGNIAIMDNDIVELSNLHRQILFTEKDIGQKKAIVIAERLQAMNQHINVQVYADFLSKENEFIVQNYDVVLDATDNYDARYLLNSACRQYKKPLISASIYQYDAQISVFNYLGGPCSQCLYPVPPPKEHTPNCSIGGVLGVLPGVAGTLQATEAIKVILNSKDVLAGKLLCFNLLSMRFTHFNIQKQDCAKHPAVKFESETTKTPEQKNLISAMALKQLLESGRAEIQLIDVREPYEREICHIGGELIPLSKVRSLTDQLNKSTPIIFYCKSGGRSEKALNIFLDSGFENVRHLEGGILSWQATIDHNLSRY